MRDTNLGMVYVLVAVLGGFAVVGRGGSPAEAPPAASSRASASPTPGLLDIRCALDARCTLASYWEPTAPLANKDTEDLWVRQCKAVDYIIALVPDPVDAHIGWLFDPLVEAIERAAEMSHYSLDRFTLPWDRAGVSKVKCAAAPSKDAGGEDTTCAAAPQQNFPGVLFFRHEDAKANPLMVLLVGETPTGGINKAALSTALDLVSCRDDGIAILGPTFSGSTRSLSITIERWLGANLEWAARNQCWRGWWDEEVNFSRPTSFCPSQPYPASRSSWSRRAPPPLRIISGSATAVRTQELASLPAVDTAVPTVKFNATVVPDDLVVESFIWDYLVDHLGLDSRDIALLTESNTAYGQGLRSRVNPAADKHPILTLPFPMHIAGVRNAAQKIKAKVSAPVDSMSAARPRLEFVLEDAPDPPDLLPQMHPRITGPAVEFVLANILATVSRREIKYLGILASDPLDKIYLAQEIKRYCPDVRLFTFESELSYAHPDNRQELAGMLVASTYPLFSRTQSWTGAQWQTPLQFSNSAAQGVYNATLAFLGPGARWLMADYGMPVSKGAGIEFAVRRQPPIWVSAVGNGGLWPLAVIDTAGAASGKNYLLPQWLVQDDGSSKEPTRGEAGSVRSAQIAWALLTLLCLVQACGYLGVRLLAGLDEVKSSSDDEQGRSRRFLRYLRIDVFGARDTGRQQPAYIVVLFATLLAVYFFISWYFVLQPEVQPSQPVGMWMRWFGFVVTGALLAALLDAALTFLLPQVRPRTARLRAAVCALLALCIVGSLAFVLVASESRVASDSSMNWFWRTLVAAPSVRCDHGAPGTEAETRCAQQMAESGRVQFMLDYERVTNLQSQLSPLVPGLLVAITWFLWARCHLRRLWLLESEETCNPLARVGALAGAGFDKAQGDLERVLRRPFSCFPACLGWLWVAPCIWLFAIMLPSFEGSGFDWIFDAAFFGASLTIVFAFTQAVSLWVQSRWLLRRLALHPMAGAYSSLPDRITRAVRETFYAYQPTLADLAHAVESWRQMAREFPDFAAHLARRLHLDAKTSEALAQSMSGGVQAANDTLVDSLNGGRGSDNALWRRKIEEHLECVAAVLVQVLAHAWELGRIPRPPKGEAKEKAERKPVETAKGDEAAAASAAAAAAEKDTVERETAWLLHAEDLVAFQVVTYLGYVFSHVRNLLSFLTVGVILLLLTVSSYPFQPQHLMTMFLFVLAMVVVIGVIASSVQMNRSEILSYMTGSTANALTFDRTLVTALVTYGAIPILGLVATLFPSIGDTLFSWLEPALRAVK